MAAPLWADDVDISNDSLHHETAEALTLRSPYTPMNPAWLFEGTFEDWLSNTYPDLELSKKTNSTQAANDILNEVWCDFLRRQELPSGSSLTVPDLLHMLRIHCTAFRILDLPLELREMIYGRAFEKSHGPSDCYCWCPYGSHNFNPSELTVAKPYDCTLEWTLAASRTGDPTLLYVSRQVRSEAGKVYYRSKQFHLFTEVYISANPEREVNTWLQTMVGEFATHLRDLTVHITYDVVGGLEYARIRAQYRQGHGLKITGSVDKRDDDVNSDEWLENTPLPFAGMPTYVAGLERIRAKFKEQGEIIVDFFSHWDELRQACAGPDDGMLYMTHDMHGRRDRYWAPRGGKTVV